MLGRKKHLAVVTAEPLDAFDAEIEKFGTELATIAADLRDRPLAMRREVAVEELDGVNRQVADLDSEIERLTELRAQKHVIRGGLRGFISTLDKYQPTQMAAE